MRNEIEYSDKSPTTTLYLSVVLGFLGVHRFYVGKILTGLLMLFCYVGIFIVPLIFYLMLEKSGFNKEGIILSVIVSLLWFFGSMAWYVVDICHIFQKRFKDAKGKVIDLSRPLPEVSMKSEKSASMMFLLFVGFSPVRIFGLHRLYVGKIWTGLLMLFLSLSYYFGEALFNGSMYVVGNQATDVVSVALNFVFMLFFFISAIFMFVWSMIDLIYMLNNKFSDKNGRAIELIRSVSDGPVQSRKSPIGTYVLARFYGLFGVHRFYVGRVFQGFLTLILLFVPVALVMSGILVQYHFNVILLISSVVGLLLWWAVDVARILTNTFTDAKGNKILLVKEPASFAKTMFFILGGPLIFIVLIFVFSLDPEIYSQMCQIAANLALLENANVSRVLH